MPPSPGTSGLGVPWQSPSIHLLVPHIHFPAFIFKTSPWWISNPGNSDPNWWRKVKYKADKRDQYSGNIRYISEGNCSERDGDLMIFSLACVLMITVIKAMNLIHRLAWSWATSTVINDPRPFNTLSYGCPSSNFQRWHSQLFTPQCTSNIPLLHLNIKFLFHSLLLIWITLFW